MKLAAVIFSCAAALGAESYDVIVYGATPGGIASA